MVVKVCHFTSTHGAKDQRIFYKECVSLSKAGYDVYLVEQGESTEESGVHIVGTGETNKGRYFRLLIRPQHVYNLALKVDADIYHFHDMELIPYALKLKKKGKKVIFDYHEDYAARFSESDAILGPRWLKNGIAKLYCTYEAWAIKQFNAVISVTPHICDRLRKVNPSTVMITNYPLIDMKTWGLDTEYCKDSNYIAFAGQISETYRLGYITKAIQEIGDVRFKICGPQRKKGELEKIQVVDANHKVDYLGVLPYTQVANVLVSARCSMVISPYGPNVGGKIGTLGNNKLFESMLCGVPVICSDYELWKQIVNENKCGLCVDPNDIEQLTNAIKYILASPKEAKRMGENGKKVVREKFNWSVEEKKLLQIYEEIVGA